MGRLGMDVEGGGPLPDNTYELVLDKVQFEYKLSSDVAGWKDNTGECSASDFTDYERQVENPDNPDKPKATSRIRLGFKVTENERASLNGRYISHDLYMNDSSAGFVNAALKALEVDFDETGFDTEDLTAAVGTHIIARITMEEREDRDGNKTGDIDNRLKGLKAA